MKDPLYDEALLFISEYEKASITGLQRKFRIGYNRAARIIEEMEKDGIVTPLEDIDVGRVVNHVRIKELNK